MLGYTQFLKRILENEVKTMVGKKDRKGGEKVARIAKWRPFNPARSVTRHLGKHIGGGALFWIAPILALLILKFLFDTIDNLAPSFVEPIAGKEITGANFLIIMAILYFTGLVLGNTVGKALGNWIKERLLPNIPLYNLVYVPAKKMLDILTGDSELGTQVVIFEPARLGWYKAGVVTAILEMSGEPPVPYFSLYEATSPTPNSGINHFGPQKEVYRAYVEIKTENEDKKEKGDAHTLIATKRELHKYHDEILKAWSSRGYMNFILTTGVVCPGKIFVIDCNGDIVKDPVQHKT
jgi:uncharacterized membrane protein